MAVRSRAVAGTLAGRAAAVRAMTAIGRVIALDDIWTTAVQQLDPDDRAAIDRGLDELPEVVGDFDSALSSLGTEIDELRSLLESATDAQVEGAVAQLFAGPVPAAVNDAYEAIFRDEITEVGPRGAAIFGCDFVLEENDAERANLRSKLDRLAGGGPPDPDLRPAFRCALYLAQLGAAAVAVIGTHGTALVAGVVGPGAGVVLGWKESRCRECWAAITRGRL